MEDGFSSSTLFHNFAQKWNINEEKRASNPKKG
jgi:hypothetical protein